MGMRLPMIKRETYTGVGVQMVANGLGLIGNGGVSSAALGVDGG